MLFCNGRGFCVLLLFYCTHVNKCDSHYWSFCLRYPCTSTNGCPLNACVVHSSVVFHMASRIRRISSCTSQLDQRLTTRAKIKTRQGLKRNDSIDRQTLRIVLIQERRDTQNTPALTLAYLIWLPSPRAFPHEDTVTAAANSGLSYQQATAGCVSQPNTLDTEPGDRLLLTRTSKPAYLRRRRANHLLLLVQCLAQPISCLTAVLTRSSLIMCFWTCAHATLPNLSRPAGLEIDTRRLCGMTTAL